MSEMEMMPAPPERAVAGYLPGLDAIRLLAVSIVIARHYGFSSLIPGGFGVTVFFFISGLLITRLLLAEEKKRGIETAAFYIRRFLRLLPPLFLTLAITAPIYLALKSPEFSWLQVESAALYLGNIHAMLADYGIFQRGLPGYRILWSLAVEEHFYLLFPLLLLLVKTRRGRIQMLCGLIAACTALRFAAYMGWGQQAESFNYNFTFARIDSIMWGCLFSIFLDGPNSLSRFRTFPIAICAILAMLACIANRTQWMGDVVQFAVEGIALGLVLNYALFGEQAGILRRIAEWRPIQMGGRISYEMYLWHLHVFTILGLTVGNTAATTAAALMLTVCISYASYMATQPLVKLRRNFGAHPVEAERNSYLQGARSTDN